MASPPAASIAAFAVAENLCAVTFIELSILPRPNILIRSFL